MRDFWVESWRKHGARPGAGHKTWHRTPLEHWKQCKQVSAAGYLVTKRAVPSDRAGEVDRNPFMPGDVEYVIFFQWMIRIELIWWLGTSQSCSPQIQLYMRLELCRERVATVNLGLPSLGSPVCKIGPWLESGSLDIEKVPTIPGESGSLCINCCGKQYGLCWRVAFFSGV